MSNSGTWAELYAVGVVYVRWPGWTQGFLRLGQLADGSIKGAPTDGKGKRIPDNQLQRPSYHDGRSNQWIACEL